MVNDNLLNHETDKERWRRLLDSHSGTILLLGLIGLGFLIALFCGGFPSILLPSFIILAFGLLGDLFATAGMPASKENPEQTKPLKVVLLIIVFYLIFAWIASVLLFLCSGTKLDKLLSKVEFPFSEASHVVVDSQDNVYVFSQFNKRIQKYNKDGRFQFGWFASNFKNTEVAIDSDDHIYVYVDYGFRKYNSNGEIIDEVDKEYDRTGWWRCNTKSLIWDKDAEEPRQYDLYEENPVQYGDVYNTLVNDGDLMPAFASRKSGFKTADSKYYKLTRLWSLFPVVSVEKEFSGFEGCIMPNPLSLTFTFVFPGFLFYGLALFFVWAMEKSIEILKKRFLLRATITVAVVVVALAAIVFGSGIVASVANALPKGNPMGFWLVPIIVIPYWIVVFVAALWTWRSLIGRLDKRNKDED